MHTKHQVIDCVRKQVIKLVNNDLLPASHGDFSGVASQVKMNHSPMGYDLERRRSLCEQICQEDDSLECPRLIRKGKYPSSSREPGGTHAGDGRSLDSKNHFREQIEERQSPDGTQFSLLNRRFMRKSKFFVPSINKGIEEEHKPRNDTHDKLPSPQSDCKEENSDPLKGFNDLQQRLMCSSRPPPVETFYESPYLKGTSGSVVPTLTESKSGGAFLSRSTNTSPVPKQTKSTNTTKDSTVQPMSLAVDKDAARRSHSFHRPLHLMQPILFVLAMFTVSMTGAYVGVMVASAGCGGYSDVECEPSILQWLFSSRRHIRAF